MRGEHRAEVVEYAAKFTALLSQAAKLGNAELTSHLAALQALNTKDGDHQ